MIDEVLIAWAKNQRIGLALLASLDEAALGASLSTRGGRSVARQFAHLCDVRRMQLERRAKRLSEGLVRFASKEEPTREELVRAIEESGARVELWFRAVAAKESGVRPMPGGLVTTLAYLVSHESHHRGSIVLTCKQSGHPVPKAARDALWGEWGRRPEPPPQSPV